MNEKIIQKQIIEALRFHENCGHLLWERTNAGVVKGKDYVTKNGFRRQNFIRLGRKGSSDIKVYCKGGVTLHLEVKGDNGKQNPNQKEWQAKLERLGHRYFKVKSVAEVEKILEGVKKLNSVYAMENILSEVKK